MRTVWATKRVGQPSDHATKRELHYRTQASSPRAAGACREPCGGHHCVSDKRRRPLPLALRHHGARRHAVRVRRVRGETGLPQGLPVVAANDEVCDAAAAPERVQGRKGVHFDLARAGERPAQLRVCGRALGPAAEH